MITIHILLIFLAFLWADMSVISELSELSVDCNHSPGKTSPYMLKKNTKCLRGSL